MAASLLSPPPLPALRSHLTPPSYRNPHRIPSPLPFESPFKTPSRSRTLTVSSALAESGSSKSVDDEAALLPLLQELSASLVLPLDYLARLPRDLRLDLNDAAFDLANGPVIDECGQEVGEMLLNLSRAWELADTSSSNNIASQFPLLHSSLTDNAKSALGKRLVSSGRRFQTMGQYGQGELQRIAKAMIQSGKVLSASSAIETDERPKKESRMLKFGDLQVELTPEKANIGAAISFVLAILTWQLSQGIQSTPESSLQYANDNALQLAKSLRGALLVISYSSTALTAFASVGLVFLGIQLRSGSKSEEL